MKKRLPYKTPEGYFETLDIRMMAAVEAARADAAEGTTSVAEKRRPRFAPYFAFAAIVAAMVFAGTFFLKVTTPRGADPDTLAGMSLSDEDIINYLIYTGCSTDSYAESYETR